mgnify:CR=1 FL=1
MLYETLSQPLIVLILSAAGFASGAIFDAFAVVKFLCLNKKVISQIFDFFAMLFCSIVFYFLNLKLLFGEIRFYSLLCFFGFLILERITIGKLLEKFFTLCYNSFVKFTKKVVSLFAKKRKKQQGDSAD